MDNGKGLTVEGDEAGVRILKHNASFNLEDEDTDTFHQEDFSFVWVGCVSLVVHSHACKPKIVLESEDEEDSSMLGFRICQSELKANLYIC